ncbi:hypothetical protein AB685_05520 [Bacillus sp. LL01]|uniref:phosphotransferase n=1 Tax=Bacillus sp. LL01 TaxID=1665556 RepID=UPI00064D6AE0|nr:phosphotransferase [Bacillus sp. LL01]KMJ60279.1 hypothetical protein AB685_05520 [Bacillus sp. LL01]
MMKADQPNCRDDFNRNRLFFRLIYETDLQIQSYSKIKNNLFKIHTDEGIYILKGYAELGNLDSIIQFSHLLHINGFSVGAMYEKFSDGRYVIADQGYYWVLTRFIPAKRRFSFLKEEDRVAGLLVLQDFHHHSKKIIPSLPLDIPLETTIQKWRNRLELFDQNAPFLAKWFNPGVISEIVYYSHLSLKELTANVTNSENVVLHGDVASHNFIRSTDNKVYLIDFDLLSIGNGEWDYVQYASRILPFLKWNRAQFESHSFLEDKLKRLPWFCAALSFPMDILREGNRFSQTMDDEAVPSSYANLSFFISTWNLRKQFLTNYNNLIQ